jgi:hypothetical protein
MAADARLAYDRAMRLSFAAAALATAIAVSLVGGSAGATVARAHGGNAGARAAAATADPAARIDALQRRLGALDRRANGGTPPATRAELRAAVARWRAAARGYGRLAADAQPLGPPSRATNAFRALSDLARWRQAQMTYAADLFSRPAESITDGAKEGLARMATVEAGLRARLRAAIARLQA